MYTTINGWTKAKMIEHINTNFKGWAGIEHSDGKTSCYYRTPEIDSRGCAVGIFIPDNMYKAEIEGSSADRAIKKIPELAAVMPLDTNGICMMQSVHDAATKDTLDHILRFIDAFVQDAPEQVAA